MISDLLRDCVAEIEEYEADEASRGTYEDLAREIEIVKACMQALQTFLDTAPGGTWVVNGEPVPGEDAQLRKLQELLASPDKAVAHYRWRKALLETEDPPPSPDCSATLGR